MIHLSRMVLKPQAVAGDAVWIFNLILTLGAAGSRQAQTSRGHGPEPGFTPVSLSHLQRSV